MKFEYHLTYPESFHFIKPDRGGIVDCQERGLKESDWDDPLDSREEGVQKYSTSTAAANAKIAAMHTSSATVQSKPLSGKNSVKTSTSTSSAISASSLIAKAASEFGNGKTIPSKSNNKNEIARPVVADASQDMKKNDDELRKMILNAPRRITKIEGSLAKHEAEIKKIDDEMLTVRSVHLSVFSVSSVYPHHTLSLISTFTMPNRYMHISLKFALLFSFSTSLGGTG